MNFPYVAVEEAVVNAVHHKDYQIAEPITITATPDKIEILSFPGPDRSISDESIQSLRMVATRYRNRRVGEFLKELHLVEGRNTGIPSLLRALETNGSDLPLFETDEERSFFRVTMFTHPAFLEDNNGAVVQVVKRKKKADVKAAIMQALVTEPMASQELALIVGYSTHRSGAYLRIINELVSEGTIAYTNPNNLKDMYQKLFLVNAK